MSRRLCRDLDSPVEDFLIVLSAVAAIVLVVLCVRFLLNHDWGKTDDERGVASSNLVTPSEKYEDDNQAQDDEERALSDEMEIVQPSNLSHYTVVHVRDGDTIDIEYNGEQTGVRLIGVDTPESVHPEKPIECYGLESSQYTKQRLEGKTIALEFDDSQGTWDDYGRLLAYVYIDGSNFNGELIKEGYAIEYTYDKPYRYRDIFIQAQTYAINNGLGLWGSCRTLESAQVI